MQLHFSTKRWAVMYLNVKMFFISQTNVIMLYNVCVGVVLGKGIVDLLKCSEILAKEQILRYTVT